MKVAPSDYERARVAGLGGHVKFFQLSVKGAGGNTESFCGLGLVAVGWRSASSMTPRSPSSMLRIASCRFPRADRWHSAAGSWVNR